MRATWWACSSMSSTWASHPCCAPPRWAARLSFGLAVQRVRWRWPPPFGPPRWCPAWQLWCCPASWRAAQSHPCSVWWQYRCSPAGNRPVRIHRVCPQFVPTCPVWLLWKHIEGNGEQRGVGMAAKRFALLIVVCVWHKFIVFYHFLGVVQTHTHILSSLCFFFAQLKNVSCLGLSFRFSSFCYIFTIWYKNKQTNYRCLN